MASHKYLITLSMARFAQVHIKGRYIIPMTVSTLERVILRFELVRGQKISRKFMGIFPALDLGQKRCWTSVFRMTVATLGQRIDRKHSSMRGHEIQHLGWNILMTHDASILHGLGFPRSNMTRTARTGDLCVRMDTPQQIPCDGIERARAEHLASTRNGIPRDGKSRDQCSDDPSTRKATQTGSLHSPLSSVTYFKKVA